VRDLQVGGFDIRNWRLVTGCLLYYITDRSAFPGDEPARRRRLLERISEAARCGVDFIQLREKGLSALELELLACEAVSAIRAANTGKSVNSIPGTRFLINSRTDVALAAGADGVHLRSDDISPSEVQAIWREATGGRLSNPVIAVSCHSAQEAAKAASGANFAVFAPVFGKPRSHRMPAGVEGLREACRSSVPVLALGGVTLENAALCLDAGAAGIAAIRLFQENEIAEVISKLR